MRGSDNFGQPRLSTCYWIYFISLNPGSKYRGKEGAGKSAFQYLDGETILQDKGYNQGFYKSLNKYSMYNYQKWPKTFKCSAQVNKNNQLTTEKTQRM